MLRQGAVSGGLHVAASSVPHGLKRLTTLPAFFHKTLKTDPCLRRAGARAIEGTPVREMRAGPKRDPSLRSG
ncbi:MAG: hypothetical protein ACRD8A_10775 [Candidatus Acidiferrales bacterium]